MLASKLTDIDEPLLQQVCAERWAESETLEFKQILPKPGDAGDKAEFVKDVSALANSGGGDLVYGISEKAGAAQAVIPLTEPLDPLQRRLDQILEAGVEPRIQGIRYHAVPVAAGHVLVMRVPASFNGPHRCITERRFVARVNSRTSDMSYEQLRAAFDRSATFADRAQAFRDEKVQDLIHRRNWKGKTAGPICVLHLVPLASFGHRFEADFEAMKRAESYVGLESWRAGGWNTVYNLDGFAVIPAHRGEVLVGMNQYYRRGQMEALLCYGAYERGDSEKSLGSVFISEFYREAATRFLRHARNLGLTGPAILAGSLLHVEGYKFAVGQLYNFMNQAISDRAHLVLPETMIEDLATPIDVDELIRPTLDVLWQCFGSASCLVYDEAGKWNSDRMRYA